MCWVIHTDPERVCCLLPAHTDQCGAECYSKWDKTSTSGRFILQPLAQVRKAVAGLMYANSRLWLENGSSQRAAIWLRQQDAPLSCCEVSANSAYFKVLLFSMCTSMVMTQRLIYKLAGKTLPAPSRFHRSFHHLPFVCVDFRCSFHLHCLWSSVVS